MSQARKSLIVSNEGEKNDVETGTIVAGTEITKSLVSYPGSGTAQDPYVVDWDKGDPEDPYNWSPRRKWAITLQVCPRPIPSIKSLSKCSPALHTACVFHLYGLILQ